MKTTRNNQKEPRIRKAVWLATLLAIVAVLTAASPWRVDIAAAAGAVSPQQESGPQIDFNWVDTVPQEVRQPVQDSLQTNRSLLPQQRLTATAFRAVDGWAKLILVPTAVVESGWEMPLGTGDLVRVFIQQGKDGQWTAHLPGAAEAAGALKQVPESLAASAAPEALGLLFPWTATRWWRVGSQGWHQGNAIDFSPLVASDDAVLASDAGSVDLVCGGPGTNDPFQSMYVITHEDGTTTGYLHLAVSSIDPSIDGQNIPRGWHLGDIYDGNAQTANNCPPGWTCQFDTPCGYGTGPHVHWTISDMNATVDGNNINTVGNSPGTAYQSTNGRVDPCGPPNSGNWIVSSTCIMTGSDSAPANVVVQNNATLTLFPAASLNIDFVNRYLRVESGSRVRIISGGRIH
jgi:murein DD-endopeptidase MepM/ murein hydrolase activator NlpD